jgi:hypothetical protein
MFSTHMGLCWWSLFNSPVLVGLLWATRNLQKKMAKPSKGALKYRFFTRRLSLSVRSQQFWQTNSVSWQFQPTWDS